MVPSEAADASHTDPTITDIATIANLQYVWRKVIRRGLRKHVFRDHYLAQDAVQFAAYEWGLTPFLNRLIDDLRAGTYSPEPADVFRGAKRSGLSRPLAFMSPRDALVYVAIVAKARTDLQKNLQPWTGSEKSDKKSTDDEDTEPGEYADWFDIWLRRQGIIAHICSTCDFVVESDISNYFGSIDIDVLTEYLHNQTSLHRDLVRLCTHIIRRSLRHPQYADSPSMGLPQESFDASRTIAHGMLSEVDQVFEIAGDNGVYSRFMDDFISGVDTRQAGEEFIANLQKSLQRLGLYPNPAKTRVVSVTRFLKDSMADENAFLESIEAKMIESKGSEGEAPGLRQVVNFPAADREELIERALSFRQLENQPERYDRVRRRYYGLFGRLGIDAWLKHIGEDITTNPDSCRSILEYARAFPLSRETMETLFGILNVHSGCYDDIPLLTLETLLTAPNQLNAGIGELIVENLKSFAAQSIRSRPPPRSIDDWLLAGSIPLIGKFGTRLDQASFLDTYVVGKPPQSVSRLQAFSLQVSHGLRSAEIFHSDLAGLPWSSVLTIDFVRAVESGDPSALGVALSLIEPVVALRPNRFQIHARPVLLCGLLARVSAPQLGDVAARATEKLTMNPPGLRDSRMIEILNDFSSPDRTSR